MPHCELIYHLVWATKQRRQWLTAAVEPLAHELIREKARALGSRVHAVNGMEDHVHLVVEIPPKVSVSYFVGRVKSVSSTVLSRRLGIGFAWQAEYAALTVSSRHLPQVVAYVEHQKEHHRSGRLRSGLEPLSQKS